MNSKRSKRTKIILKLSVILVVISLVFSFGLGQAVSAQTDTAQTQSIVEEAETSSEQYENTALQGASASETILMVLLSVLIICEIAGSAVIIVLIIKKKPSKVKTTEDSLEEKDYE